MALKEKMIESVELLFADDTPDNRWYAAAALLEQQVKDIRAERGGKTGDERKEEKETTYDDIEQIRQRVVDRTRQDSARWAEVVQAREANRKSREQESAALVAKLHTEREEREEREEHNRRRAESLRRLGKH